MAKAEVKIKTNLDDASAFVLKTEGLVRELDGRIIYEVVTDDRYMRLDLTEMFGKGKEPKSAVVLKAILSLIRKCQGYSV